VEVTTEPRQGYFSLLRWRPDEARDEPRNIGVIVLDPEFGQSDLRPLPVSQLSPKLHEQGILDAALIQIRERISRGGLTPAELQSMGEASSRVLLITEPQPVAVVDIAQTLRALYRSFVASRSGGSSNTLTKGAVTDRVVDRLRLNGWTVKRGSYIEDFIFDVVIEAAPVQHAPSVMSILSYGSTRKDWSPIEKDAGHFLCALGQMDDLSGVVAVLAPPTDAPSDARRSHQRVLHMLDRAEVPIRDAREYLAPQRELTQA
jgi:hypothetical protein